MVLRELPHQQPTSERIDTTPDGQKKLLFGSRHSRIFPLINHCEKRVKIVYMRISRFSGDEIAFRFPNDLNAFKQAARPSRT